jgi:hypothetical protein
MKVRTTLAPLEYPIKISHKDKIMTMGSCFAENISLRLNKYKFSILENPFGIIYNPVTISKGLTDLINNRIWTADDIENSGEKYFSFDFHGSFAGLSISSLLEKINDSAQEASAFLQTANFIIISLGTSFAFKHNESKKFVANCHKLPQNNFERIGLQENEIVRSLSDCIRLIKTSNPNISIILTVSPVRHLRDGLIENNLSKAILLKSVHRLCSEELQTYYFPSYELLIDDLRDYRYYDTDLTHPNQQAIDYIWEYFSSSFFTDGTNKINSQLLKIYNGVHHRPFLPQSQSHKTFVQNLLKEIQQITLKHPRFDFTDEIKFLNNFIET